MTGTGVALVTPFHRFSVDYEGLGRLIDHVIAGGIEYVVSLGTTGETATLTATEQLAVLDYTLERVAGRCGVVAGFGGNNTAKLCEEVRNYHFDGVTAILSASPAYNKPTQEGIYRHYLALAEAAPRPIILYNVPARTACNMTAETTLRLAAHGTSAFLGIKEASGNLAQVMALTKHAPANFLVISGDDNLTLPMLALGARGLISVSANAYPHEVTRLVNAALAGEYATARKLHFALQDLTDLLFAEGNPAGIKAALSHIGICSPDVRLPLVAASEKLQLAIAAEAHKSLLANVLV